LAISIFRTYSSAERPTHLRVKTYKKLMLWIFKSLFFFTQNNIKMNIIYNNRQRLFNHLFIVIILLTITSCGNEDDPIIPNEEELITTLQLILTENNGSTTLFEFQDVDGDGGMNPSITEPTLKANTLYTGEIVLLNESVSPPDNITLEVEEEGLDHQLFYQVSQANIEISYDDRDENDNPIGINTLFTTGASSTGKIVITLRHEPDKNANGVNMGLISNAGGETDIEVEFAISIQ
jgi:hypothetical protein